MVFVAGGRVVMVVMSCGRGGGGGGRRSESCDHELLVERDLEEREELVSFRASEGERAKCTHDQLDESVIQSLVVQ